MSKPTQWHARPQASPGKWRFGFESYAEANLSSAREVLPDAGAVGGPYVRHVFGDAVTQIYRQHRGWLTAAVHTSVAWPERDVMVSYHGADFFLRGARQDESERRFDPCISMKCSDGQEEDVLHKIYRFASVLGWFLGGYVDVVGYGTGSAPILYGAGRQPFGNPIQGGPHGFSCNHLPIVSDEKTRIALAFWREGLRLDHLHAPFSFLSFFKVLESQFSTAKERIAWIERALPTLTQEADKRVRELTEQGTDVGIHIYESGRCAVAHAGLDREIVDPDIPADRIRIQKDLAIIRALAEKYIREELQVPTEMDVHRGRNRLATLFGYMRDGSAARLRAGRSVGKNSLGLSGLVVDICVWPHPPGEHLKGLALQVLGAYDGIAQVSALNSTQTLELVFQFDFTKGHAHPDIESSGFEQPLAKARVEEAVALIEYRKAVLGNQIVEIVLPNDEKIECEVVIPCNVDIGGTFQAWDQQIERMRAWARS